MKTGMAFFRVFGGASISTVAGDTWRMNAGTAIPASIVKAPTSINSAFSEIRRFVGVFWGIRPPISRGTPNPVAESGPPMDALAVLG
jgi:hypothetical protein